MKSTKMIVKSCSLRAISSLTTEFSNRKESIKENSIKRIRIMTKKNKTIYQSWPLWMVNPTMLVLICLLRKRKRENRTTLYFMQLT